MSMGRQLFWVGVMVAGVALVAPNLQSVEPGKAEEGPASTATAPAPGLPQAGMATGPSIGNGFASQELVREPDGHFYAEAQVNGARIRFMIDTGASFVALTREDAQRAGIPLGSQRATVMGAGGPVEVIPVTIDRIALGVLAATRVQGAVADELGVSLLGQSFLSRIANVEIHGDRMVLR